MCNPAYIQIASAGFGFLQQSQNANAQTNAISNGLGVQLNGYQQQAAQTTAAAADDSSQRAREAMIERGRIAAVVADSGLGGVSADRTMNESRYTESADIATIRKNRDNTLMQIGQEMLGAGSTAASRIAGVSRPSLIGTGLQIAGSYATQKNADANRSQKTGT